MQKLLGAPLVLVLAAGSVAASEAGTAAPTLAADANPPAASQPDPASEPAEAGSLPATTPALDDDDDARQMQCLQLVEQDRLPAARACLQQLAREARSEAAALRARSALETLQRVRCASPAASASALHLPTPAVDRPWIPPGRLELTSTTGLFGAWQGTALGIIGVTLLKGPEWQGVLLVGGSAVVSGVGMGVGGYALANALELDEADSLLTASGLLWGTVLGIATLPVLNDIGANLENLTADDVLRAYLATVLLVGWAGGGVTLGLTRLLDVTPGHVSMMNSGGWIGSVAGLTAAASLLAATNGSFSPSGTSAAYTSLAMLGLGSGALVGSFDWFSRGEVLVGDLGGILGGIALGSVAVAALAGGLNLGNDGASTLFAGGAITTGSLAGFAGALTAIHLLRGNSAADDATSLAERAAERWVLTPTLQRDDDGQLLPGVLLVARF